MAARHTTSPPPHHEPARERARALRRRRLQTFLQVAVTALERAQRQLDDPDAETELASVRARLAQLAFTRAS